MLLFCAREEIEIKVVNLLEDYLGEVVYPLDIDALIEKMGIIVTPYPEHDAYKRQCALSASKDAFSLCSPSYEYAEIMFNPNAYSKTRSSFSKGHEVGHIYLEHLDLNDPLSENEADYFSGYLLAPHPLIAKYRLEDKIAQSFCVGDWCADVSLNQLNDRKRHGGPLKEHEQRLLSIASMKGGSYMSNSPPPKM